jgi:hypothetical protein
MRADAGKHQKVADLSEVASSSEAGVMACALHAAPHGSPTHFRRGQADPKRR